MDSANSGSINSSSGGDEEYDSRSESISAFLNSSAVGSGGQMLNPSQLHQSHHHPPSFDSLSNYLDTFQRSPLPSSNISPFLNLDTSWNKGPPPNCTDIGGLMRPSSSNPPIQTVGSIHSPFSSNNMSQPTPLLSDNGSRSDHPTVRNPKKRSRASRRAPTTVLTTDTSNFRAMVQEFTGIPAPPFSSSPFPRGGRLDLFNTALRTGLSDALPPPYLLRPFAQKLQRSAGPFGSLPPLSNSSSSTMVDTISSTSTNTSRTNANSPANSNNYQLPSELGLSKSNQSLLNLQNPIFALQSFLQSSSPKYPLPNLPIFGGKSQAPPVNPMIDEFSTRHGAVSTNLGPLPNLATSDAMSLRGDNPSSWGDGVGLNSDGDHGLLKSLNVNYGNLQRVNSCKMNYTGSSSEFHAEKAAENASSRGEGMVDSWICSSD